MVKRTKYIFDKNECFKLPSCENLKIKMIGGWGGGAGSVFNLDTGYASGGGGGGSGQTKSFCLKNVKSCTKIKIYIGKGGNGGINGVSGQNGNKTVIKIGDKKYKVWGGQGGQISDFFNIGGNGGQGEYGGGGGGAFVQGGLGGFKDGQNGQRFLNDPTMNMKGGDGGNNFASGGLGSEHRIDNKQYFIGGGGGGGGQGGGFGGICGRAATNGIEIGSGGGGGAGLGFDGIVGTYGGNGMHGQVIITFNSKKNKKYHYKNDQIIVAHLNQNIGVSTTCQSSVSQTTVYASGAIPTLTTIPGYTKMTITGYGGGGSGGLSDNNETFGVGVGGGGGGSGAIVINSFNLNDDTLITISNPFIPTFPPIYGISGVSGINNGSGGDTLYTITEGSTFPIGRFAGGGMSGSNGNITFDTLLGLLSLNAGKGGDGGQCGGDGCSYGGGGGGSGIIGVGRHLVNAGKPGNGSISPGQPGNFSSGGAGGGNTNNGGLNIPNEPNGNTFIGTGGGGGGGINGGQGVGYCPDTQNVCTILNNQHGTGGGGGSIDFNLNLLPPTSGGFGAILVTYHN